MIDIAPRFSVSSVVGFVGLALCIHSMYPLVGYFQTLGFLTVLPVIMMVTLCVNTAVACTLNLLQRDFIHIRRYGRKCLVEVIVLFVLFMMLMAIEWDGILILDMDVVFLGMILMFVSSVMMLIRGFRGHRL